MNTKKVVTTGAVAAGLGALGLILWRLSADDIHELKDIAPDADPTGPSTTGYKRVDAILDKLRQVARDTGIPLGLLVAWIAKESGGKLSDTTSLDERGYFQLIPAESKSLGIDHQRLSTDSDYSIDSGVKLIRDYQSKVNDLGVTPAGTSYYWRLVKLGHSMGSGQLKKVVKAAQAAGQAGTWDALEAFALGMKINGPQPKKWFPFVDSIYKLGKPFGFGSETQAVVGHRRTHVKERSMMIGLDVIGADKKGKGDKAKSAGSSGGGSSAFVEKLKANAPAVGAGVGLLAGALVMAYTGKHAGSRWTGKAALPVLHKPVSAVVKNGTGAALGAAALGGAGYYLKGKEGW